MTAPRIRPAPSDLAPWQRAARGDSGLGDPDPEAMARIAMGRPAEDSDPPTGGMRLDMLLMVAWIVAVIVGAAWAVLS